MAIQLFAAVRSRCRIGLVDEDPTPDVVAALRGYEPYRCDDASVADSGLLATTAAVIFQQSQLHPNRIVEQLTQLAPALLWHGCLIFIQPIPMVPGASAQRLRSTFVRAINDLQLPVSGLTADELSQLGGWVGKSNTPVLTPLVYVTEPDDWNAVLMVLQMHPPGDGPTPGPHLLVKDADGNDQELGHEQTLLVQRAFYDSSKVHLEELRNGLSGVRAYRAYVDQQVNRVGDDWPYRYFVKIGPRNKVATEYLAYRDIALEHLPYHLGPRLRLERCALGHKSGIIVSDYVCGAETLRDCARDSRSAAALANLFNVTLRAWHNSARPEDAPLEEHLRKRFPAAVPSFRKHLIEEYGAKKNLDELRVLLLARDSRPVRMGVIHGDLHATNVLVRGGDAILIDFEKVETAAPVLRDLACLEGGLFVDGFIKDRRDPTAIIASIECLYGRNQMPGDRVNPCHPMDGSAWFFDCVMQIRMQARQIEPDPTQYALVLASELLHKACNSHNFDEDLNGTGGGSATGPGVRMEQTRAMAYLLAERILVGLSAVATTT